MEIRQIPLSRLLPANEDQAIRKDYDAKAIKRLSKNIEKFGLLVPLLVKAVDGYINFEVVDGNRRLMALQMIDADPEREITCVLGSEVEASKGAALSANIMREDMNPMDVYDVYADMVAAGSTEKEIGKAFSKTRKEVAQILALAGLAPEIKQDLRDNVIGWETAQALTVVRGHERQLAIRVEAGDNDWKVREILNRTAPNLAHALFDKDEYFKRGGGVLVDLFSEQQDNKPQLCDDRDLFWELQNLAIELMIEKLMRQGWLTVVNANDGEKVKIDTQWPWRENIKSKKERKLHTVFYEVDDDGEFALMNRVKPVARLVEKAKEEKQKTKLAEAEAAGEPIEMTGNKPMSMTLVEQLKHVRNVQVKAALAMNPNLAARVLLMMLIQAKNGQRHGIAATDMFWSNCLPLPGSFEKHQVWATQQGEYEQLGNQMISDGWAQVLRESDRGILDRLAYIATMAINAHYPGARELINAILQQQPVEARAVWQPKAAFWKQTGRAFMLKTLGEIIGEGPASRFKNEKVVDLARQMERWFCEPDNLTWLNFGGKDEPLADEMKEKLRSWRPAILGIPDKAMLLAEIFHEEQKSYDIDGAEELDQESAAEE